MSIHSSEKKKNLAAAIKKAVMTALTSRRELTDTEQTTAKSCSTAKMNVEGRPQHPLLPNILAGQREGISLQGDNPDPRCCVHMSEETHS
ncbi:hypothetical protein BaRGS_00006135 [Batillaria attramentaria]|uniref:Uncharacterized protein n=1 Tax=Batillaria attramentaria TaxID=370345 RepID=A0ABD0LTA5_9CAEN